MAARSRLLGAISAATNQLAARRAELALSLRITAAGLLSFIVGHTLGLAQVYWAVMTAVIVTQVSIGGSLKAAVDRFIATLIGAGWGVAATLAVPHGSVTATAAALAAALVPLGLVVAVRPNYRVAPVTGAIVLLGPLGAANPVTAALSRVGEIAVGSVVALAVALAVTPSSAHRLLAEAAGEALQAMRDQTVLLLGGLAARLDAAAVLRGHDRIRTAIERANAIAGEAEHERAVYLSDAPASEPLVRTLRRLSHDLVMVARALYEPLPEPARDRLAEPLGQLAQTLGAVFGDIAASLVHRVVPRSVEALGAAMAGYESAMASLRRERIIAGLPGEDAERVFGLAFALQQLARNLGELAARAAELAGAPAVTFRRPRPKETDRA